MPPTKKHKKAKHDIPSNVEMMDTADIKYLFPPNAIPWKSRGDSGWHCQVRGWPSSINRSARKYGDESAVKIVISLSWWQHSVLTPGFAYADAPVGGLLLEEALQPFL